MVWAGLLVLCSGTCVAVQCEKLAAAVCLVVLPLAMALLLLPLIPSRVVEVLRCLQLCYPN